MFCFPVGEKDETFAHFIVWRADRAFAVSPASSRFLPSPEHSCQRVFAKSCLSVNLGINVSHMEEQSVAGM